MASLPPAEVGWSMSDGGISTVGQHWLEYELQKILTVGWGINYISHHCTLAVLPAGHILRVQGVLLAEKCGVSAPPPHMEGLVVDF